MNNSKEQTGKEGKSAEEIKALIYEGVTKHAAKHGSMSCRSVAIISMGKYAKPFQQRIAELEASASAYKKQISELQSHLFTERRSKERSKQELQANTDKYFKDLEEFSEINKSLEAELKRKDEAYRLLLKKFDQFANLKHIDEESGEEHSGYHLAYAVRFAANAIIREAEQALKPKDR